MADVLIKRGKLDTNTYREKMIQTHKEKTVM